MLNSADTLEFKKILQRNVILPLVICVTICSVFIFLFIHLNNLSAWVDHTNNVMTKSYESLKLIVDSETGLRGYLLTDKEVYLDPYHQSMDVIDGQLEELKELVQDNPAQVQQVEVIQKLSHQWKKAAGDLAHKKISKEAIKEGSVLRKDLMDQIRIEFRRFVTAELRLRDQRTSEVRAQSKAIVIVTVVLSLLAGAFLALIGRKQLLGLSGTYENSLRMQSEQNQELSEQAWLRTGQADLAYSVKGELSVEEIGINSLNFFSDYIKANVGTLFVSKEDRVFERVSSVGFSEKDSPASKAKFLLGEGVIGSVGQSGKALSLTNVPEQYLKVSSSIGDASPREIHVIPLMAAGSIEGVLELGFLEPQPARHIKLLEQVAEIMASAVKSALYRERLQALLEETQVQSEELQAQQEELKVSNEELTERSQALSQTQVKLESQHAELEQINIELEGQKQVLDEQNRLLKLTQGDLEKKSKDLQESSRYKSEFLANMSHELRTPLNSTLILSKLLRDNNKGNLTSEQVEYANTIYSSGNDLLNLINDILDLSKVEAGKLDTVIEKFAVDDIFGSMKNLFQPLVKQKKLELKLTMEESAPGFIYSDRLRIEQIIKNLLSNAIKFTEKGSVSIIVKSSEAGEISFDVVDTGIGMKKEVLDKIFEAFHQADGTTNRKYGGTGLGLTISRNLADLLGGHIQVESAFGKGSTFTLTIPVKAEGQKLVPAPQFIPPTEKEIDVIEVNLPVIEDDREKLPVAGKKVLMIVEDEKTFAELLLKISREQGFLCLAAQTCRHAMTLALQHIPDAIVLDMKLPDGLGLALLDQLKENTKTRHIPVHVISSADFSREALHLGAIGYLQKPAEVSEIQKSLTKLQDKMNQKLKKVLIVEDDDVQRKAVEQLIRDTGVEITSVHAGLEAFELMKKNIYDCAIVDLTLADISGFKLLEMIRSQSDFLSPPVIVYTGRSLSLEEEQNLRQYSRSIIIKGARSPERLLSEVTLFLHQVESHLSEEKRNILKVGRSREKFFDQKKILLVDDDVRNIFALMSVLEIKGATVITARNGLEALEKVRENADIGLILMDIMMPEMDGYTAIKEIRKKYEKEKLPIIALTAKAMKDDYEKCMEVGANDYLSKPVDVDKLMSLMRVWIPSL